MVATRRPKLRVVRHPLEARPRHRVAYGDRESTREIVEFFTEAEWAALHPAERPDSRATGHLPGIGYIAKYLVELDEFDDATEEYSAAIRGHKFLRGMEV